MNVNAKFKVGALIKLPKAEKFIPNQATFQYAHQKFGREIT